MVPILTSAQGCCAKEVTEVKPVEREHHLRKQIGGAALILAPIAGLMGAIASPALDSDELDWIGNLAAGTDRAWIGSLLGVASIALGVFAVLALVHLVRERAPEYGDVGGAAAVVGLVLSTLYFGMAAMANEMARSAVAETTSAQLVNDALTSPVGVAALIGSLLFPVGLVVLATGLYRAQAAPILTAVGLGLFAVAAAVGYLAFSTPLLVAGFAVLTASLAPLGWQVLREPDEAWEHAPTFRGFHARTA